MKAKELKMKIRGSMLPQWRIAKAMGMSESTMYRRLRDDNEELPEQFEAHVLNVIRVLKRIDQYK